MASGMIVARGVARSQKPREAHIVQDSLKNELRKRYSDFGIRTEAHLEIAMARSAAIIDNHVVSADSPQEIAEFVRTQYGGLFGAEPGTVAATPPTATHAPSAQKPQQPPAPKDPPKVDPAKDPKKENKPAAPAKKENKPGIAPATPAAGTPKSDGTAEAPKA
jgi:hypothetical protein